jgi:hypothetical protein
LVNVRLLVCHSWIVTEVSCQEQYLKQLISVMQHVTICENYIAAFVIVGNGLHMIGLGLGVLNNNALLRVICWEVDKR